MKYLFAVAYLVIGLVVATRIRNVSGRFAIAYPNVVEHTARERIACWFQLVFFLTLLVLSVRLVARFAVSRNEQPIISVTERGPSAADSPVIDQTEQAKKHLFADFYFELDQIPEEPHPKH